MLYFSYTDRDDNPVDCSMETWDHIVEDRAIMEGRENVVKEVLRRPDVITRGKRDRECWYLRGVHPEAPDDFVKVVLAYQGELQWRRGTIITAFLASRVHPEEVLLWPPK